MLHLLTFRKDKGWVLLVAQKATQLSLLPTDHVVCDSLGYHIFLHVPGVGQEKHDLAHENCHSVLMEMRNVVTLHKHAGVGVVVVLQLEFELHFVKTEVYRWEVDQSQQERIIVPDKAREQVK